MSCWMTGNKELAILANYVARKITRDEQMGVVEGLTKFSTQPALRKAFDDCVEDGWHGNPRKVFASLHGLNVAAYKDRYGECREEETPEMPEVVVNTDEKTRRDWQVRLHWLLSFFLYQTAEGEVTNDPRRLALEKFADSIAYCIAKDEAKDKDLRWGEF